MQLGHNDVTYAIFQNMYYQAAHGRAGKNLVRFVGVAAMVALFSMIDNACMEGLRRTVINQASNASEALKIK